MNSKWKFQKHEMNFQTRNVSNEYIQYNSSKCSKNALQREITVNTNHFSILNNHTNLQFDSK